MFYQIYKTLVYKYLVKINTKKLIGYKSKLNYRWTLWYHNLNYNNWSIDSYQKLYNFSNISDFWKLYNNHYKLNYGMFFLMKDNIKPIWEVDENKNGGNWSIKVIKNIEKTWLNLSMDLIGNTLDKKNIVNGISLSYKNNYYIIKIWINDKTKNDLNNINIPSDLKNNIIFNKYK